MVTKDSWEEGEVGRSGQEPQWSEMETGWEGAPGWGAKQVQSSAPNFSLSL